jgi:hypothetical protein
LYKIKTGSTSTTVLRYDPWEGPTNIANIRWPLQTPVKGKGKDDLKGVFVQTNASRTKAVEHFLKYGKLSGCVSLRAYFFTSPHSSLVLVVLRFPITLILLSGSAVARPRTT